MFSSCGGFPPFGAAETVVAGVRPEAGTAPGVEETAAVTAARGFLSTAPLLLFAGAAADATGRDTSCTSMSSSSSSASSFRRYESSTLPPRFSSLRNASLSFRRSAAVSRRAGASFGASTTVTNSGSALPPFPFPFARPSLAPIVGKFRGSLMAAAMRMDSGQRVLSLVRAVYLPQRRRAPSSPCCGSP